MAEKHQKIIWEFRGPRGERPFLQPLAVGIVCAVFVALILGMGVMDLQRMDRTLVGFLENRGLGIVSVVQRLAQENLNQLIQASKREETRPAPPDPISPKIEFAPAWYTKLMPSAPSPPPIYWFHPAVNDCSGIEGWKLHEPVWPVVLVRRRCHVSRYASPYSVPGPRSFGASGGLNVA